MPAYVDVARLERRELLAGFTPGNILVNTVGVGNTLDTSATTVAIREYGVDDLTAPTTATLVNTVTAPFANSGNNSGNLTDSGSISSHGALNLSTDGERISLTGFDAPSGLTSVATTDASVNNRVVGTLTADGQLARDLYGDAFTGTGIRAASSGSSTKHWMAGGNGVRYGSAGTSANITTLLTPRSATITTDNSGNQFLTGVTSGTVFIWTLPNSLPTSTVGAQTLTLPSISNDLAEVVMLDRSPTRGATNLGGIDTIYVTNGQSGTSGSITKYEWTGTAWTQRGVRTYGNGLNGLTARVTATGAVQFFVTTRVSTGDNQLLTRTDNAAFGSDMSTGSFTVLASAGAGYAFRGVAFAPDEATEASLTLTAAGVVNANGTPVTLVSGVTYANGSSFKGGSLEITGSASGDTLSIANLTGQITTSGSNVLFNDVVIGTVTGGNDATPLRIDFNGRNSANDVTTAMVSQLLKQIQMTTASTDSSRTLTFTLRQAANHKSVVDSTSATVTVAINRAPTAIQLTSAVTSLAEDRSTAAPLLLGGLVVTDDAYGANQVILSGSGASAFEVVDNQLWLKAGTPLDFETVPSYAVTIGVDDPAIGSGIETQLLFTLAVTDVNEPPTAVELINTTTVLAEQTLTADLKVADIVVTDDALGTESLVLTGPDKDAFVIAGAELFLRAATYAAALKDRYTATVTVDDASVGASPDASVPFVLTIQSANLPPTGIRFTNVTTILPENSSVSGGRKLADIEVVDDDQGTNELSLSGADVTAFELRGTELWLKESVNLNFEAAASYEVTVRVDDLTVGHAPDATSDFRLDILDVNEAPSVYLSSVVAQLTETALSPSPRKMADVVVVDDALGTETISLSGPDAAQFELVGNELYLRAGTVFDFETAALHTVSVDVDDPTLPGDPDARTTLNLQILDVYEPPEIEVSVTSVPVADGGTVNFGQVTPGTTVSRTFTVTNTGSGALKLQPITLTGTDFTLISGNFSAGQRLAVNASVTFTVTMNTADAGTKNGTLSFANDDPNEFAYDIVLTGAVITPSVGTMLIDDGDSGFILSGSWSNVAGYGYGKDAKAAGGSDGSRKATWTFGGLPAGQYRIEATWLPGTDRASAAPYSIRDGVGGPLLGTSVVNQRLAPSGASAADGRPFASLGTITLTGGTLVVELANLRTDGIVVADALRLIDVTPPPSTPEIDILDGAMPLADESSYDFGQATQGSVATRTLTVKNTGTAALTLQPIVVIGAAFSLVSPNFTAGQSLAPHATASITVAMNTTVVGSFAGRLSLANGDADEGLFDLVLTGKVNPAGATTLTMDDGEAGFLLTGAWNSVTGYGYGSDAKAAGSKGTNRARWSFSGLTPGEYRIAATWLHGTDRASNAPYVILDRLGGTVLATIPVNQRTAPAGGTTAGGRPFANLGTVTITGAGLVIELANTGANGVIIADAVRIERVTPPANAPRISVTESTNLLPDQGTLSFGSAVQGAAALSRTITVKNTGTADLILQPITLAGAGFSLVTPNFTAGQTLGPNAELLITVQLNTNAAGTFNGSLSFGHSDDGPFDLVLTGSINPPLPAGVDLIDDGDTRFSTVGNWSNVAGAGYGSDARAVAGNDGSKKAYWNFTGLTAGTYQIDLTWLHGTDRASNALYVLRDGGGTVLSSVNVNQKVAPAGAASGGGRPFATLGTVVVTGDTLVIELSNLAANGVIIADAIRIRKIS